MPFVIAVDPRAPQWAALSEAARVLRTGGLVAFPTETVYGLGALAFDELAVARLFVAKGRPTHHPLIAHVKDEEHARSLAAKWPPVASALAGAFWPGPLTLVVDRARHVPAAVAGGGASVAVRVPSHPVALALLTMLKQPLAAPSANRYQGLSPTTAAHVIKELGDRVDLVLDAGPCDAGIESTVIDVRCEPSCILRLGATTVSSLRAVVPGLRTMVDFKVPSSDAPRASPGMDIRHYAPRAPMTIAPSRERAISIARAMAVVPGRPVGVLVIEEADPNHPNLVPKPMIPASDNDPRLIIRVLPRDPSEYARRIYATLHELDDERPLAIVVQAVPAGDDGWAAVADRLAKGSTRR